LNDLRPEFSSDIDVQLVKASAKDTDVVFAARVSTIGEASLKTAEDSGEGLIRYLMRDRHGSPFEHNSMTFFLKAPIFVFRELMRHRIASYNEESARYRELRPLFYVPDERRKIVQVGKPGAYTFVDGDPEQKKLVQEEYRKACTASYESYRTMLGAGVAREVARGVLPVTIFSTAYMTINARSLMNLLSLRRHVEGSAYPSFPQREIEMLAEGLEEIWATLMPQTHRAFVDNGRVAP